MWKQFKEKMIIHADRMLLGSDFHFREDTPVGRTDNYWEAQWKKLDFIVSLQEKYNCPVVHAGDLFDHWKPSPRLLTETIRHLPEQFYTIYGQHDLPSHSLSLVEKCGVVTLQVAQQLNILSRVHWGEKPTGNSSLLVTTSKGIKRRVLVWHTMNYKGRLPWPGCTDPSAISLLRKYPEYDLILTGDNHKTFTEQFEGRILVNPGSLMRMDADQIDYHPCIFLWDVNENTVEPVYLPIEEGVITRDHIEKIEQRDNRIDAYIAKLNSDWETSVSFVRNLEEFQRVNQVRSAVMEIVYKVTEINATN